MKRVVNDKAMFRNTCTSMLKTVKNDLIRIIDAKIETARRSGYTNITHKLPLTFNIPGMVSSDAQLYIYSEILTSYKIDKKFENTFIELRGSETILYIYWSFNNMDEVERTKRTSLIKDSLWNPRMVKKFD